MIGQWCVSSALVESIEDCTYTTHDSSHLDFPTPESPRRTTLTDSTADIVTLDLNKNDNWYDPQDVWINHGWMPGARGAKPGQEIIWLFCTLQLALS